jgi:hypothetical protein
MLSCTSASPSSSHTCTTTHSQQQQQQSQIAAVPCSVATDEMNSNSRVTDAVANAVEKTLPDCCNGAGAGAGASVECNQLLEEQQRYQQYYHQHQQQQQQAELITNATADATVSPALMVRKGRKLRRRRKKSAGCLDDLDDPSTTSTRSTGTPSVSSVTSTAVDCGDDEGASETPKPLTRANRRAMQNQNQNPNANARIGTNRSIINMSSRANPTNAVSNPSKSSNSSRDHNTKGKKKGGTYSESAVLKELYVAIRCEFVPGSSNNNVRRVVLVSWDHQSLWEACLDDNHEASTNPLANDNNDSGARSEWTITEYSNNKNNSSSNHKKSSNNHKNNSKNNSSHTILNCETAPSPNLRIWRHQSFQQVRFQLQQQIAARVLIGHGLSQILAAWQLPRHPACNVRDAATFSAYMQERVDPLSIMVVPRSLERDLMLNYLNMVDTGTDSNTDALLQQAVACMMLYQRSRVEWEQDVARWMQQQERQRAIRNERLASLSMSMQHQQQPLEHQHMCCESYPIDKDLSAAADCWSTAGSNYAEDMEGHVASVPPPSTAMSSSSKVRRSQELTLTQPTSTVGDDDDDEDYDYDGALVAAVESISTVTPIKTQDAAVAVVAAAVAAGEWNGWSTPFLSSVPTPRTTTTPPSKSSKDRTTWGSMLALPPPPHPKESSHPVSSEDLFAEPIAAPCFKYPLTLLEEEDEEYDSDFGGGPSASFDGDDDADTGGHLPSRLLNDSSDEEEDHVTLIPWREKRGSGHPIDGDDWLDQDDQDQQHQQQQPKAVSQAYWFRRRQSVSPPCVRTDIGGSSKYDSSSNIRSPSKPRSERFVRRGFFSPLASEMRKSPPQIATATMEGKNLRARSATETTTTLMAELSTF